ncbi:mitochondrial ATP synthase F1, epsilon subunit, putative [Babesia microti strain RI]|uniref:Mitochondrial ATP synthase F1, epsilon subunit, putative n=1 Tax=Babesia microti (strain RI) TaxID=1133968 RepID=A0A0K3AN45_BABMR|nr:mitochondrial ATP synthase F1, epsilon subunit, putative [Babesia microti strain RI]CTQ41149.1 mitochondrial ATP synthase F1, epsilon subunit, putative [Babesia microti strain RI]|eukprot:XP_012649160.1 mitochondrial ATP synthase F1, epsilon subunit, putative [Babesia microti strain RI]
MWRYAGVSYNRYAIEMAQILCKCLKDPFRDIALSRHSINIKENIFGKGDGHNKVLDNLDIAFEKSVQSNN